jgi:hypothetical protein
MSTDAHIPHDFPHSQRLGDAHLFRAVLGNMARSTFARKLSEQKLPPPIRVGHLNKWPEPVMAKVRDAGVA